MPSGAVYSSNVHAPPRWLLRPSGVLTQVASAFSLLIGTIGFVLVQVNHTGGAPFAIAWAAAAMVGLVLGGLMARGGIAAVIGAALANVGMGGVLLLVDQDTLSVLLKLLPRHDVEMIEGILFAFGLTLIGIGVLCVASIPQARRYHRELRAAEDDAEKSGIWEVPFVPTTIPAPGAPPPAPPLPPSLLPAAPGGGSASSGALATSRPSNRDLPLPAPPPSRDGFGAYPHARPSAPQQPSSATAPGWQPAPVKTHRTTMMIVRPRAEERRSRRRVYIALGGLAIGLGAGVGVLVSSSRATKTVATAPVTLDKPTAPAHPGDHPTPRATPTMVTTDAGMAELDALTNDERIASAPSGALVEPTELVAQQHKHIEALDAKGLAMTFAPNGFIIGLDAADLAEGRAGIAEVIARNLGSPPNGKITVTSRFEQIGRDLNHVWIAEELELTSEGLPSRRITMTQLAAYVDGMWSTVVAHWARPVADTTAEKLAILGTLPTPSAFTAKATNVQLGSEVAAMFASRQAFANARSLREDAFNFGSAPGERMTGGQTIAKLFSRLKSQLRADGPIRAVHGAEWDPSQTERQRIGYAALNVAYTQKSRAATDVTQTFRVLAVLLFKNDGWQVVQTHFSNAGPIAD